MSTIKQTSSARNPRISRAYWFCQFAGWLALLLFQLLILSVLKALSGQPITRLYVAVVLLCISGFLLSHLFYLAIRRRHWLQIPLRKVWPRMLAGVALLATIQCGMDILVSAFLSHGAPFHQNTVPAARLISWLADLFLFALWLTIYLAVHEFRGRRIAEVNALRLELVAQEAQLRGLRAQLNPHFLFNCLNSLRELIVEDPRRAQTMVMQLSGLLRYSLQSDQTELVLLEDEIRAVKDYLALEAVRFEDRLRVAWNIASEANKVPVPPMLLQTLVENALKHGISRRPEGGEIHIQALVRGSQLALEVRNTGELPTQPSQEGIGLRNARARLQLLYGDRARIVLESVDGTQPQVRALGTIPLKRAEAVQ